MNNSKALSLIALLGSLKAASIVGGFNNEMMCQDFEDMVAEALSGIEPDYGLIELEMGSD